MAVAFMGPTFGLTAARPASAAFVIRGLAQYDAFDRIWLAYRMAVFLRLKVQLKYFLITEWVTDNRSRIINIT